jgi:hypothetical protein
MTKPYTIEFVYTDNDQVYLEDIDLTVDEYVRLNSFLDAMEEAGEIKREGGGNPMLYPYTPSEFSTFARLELRWTQGSLVSSAQRHGISL